LLDESVVLPTDEELSQGRVRTEDALLERKTFGDSQDWVKTVVGFANSVPLGRYGLLYIGVRDNGDIEPGTSNLDQVQKTLRGKLQGVFPPIDYTPRVLVEGSRSYLCVIVPGSAQRPHFSGAAYVRIGSETVKASQQQFELLIAERNSKVYRILQLEGKHVRIHYVRSSRDAAIVGRDAGIDLFRVVGCSEFAATFRDRYEQTKVIALDRVSILDEAGSVAPPVLEIRDN
jgi:hypothetical protein